MWLGADCTVSTNNHGTRLCSTESSRRSSTTVVTYDHHGSAHEAFSACLAAPLESDRWCGDVLQPARGEVAIQRTWLSAPSCSGSRRRPVAGGPSGSAKRRPATGTSDTGFSMGTVPQRAAIPIAGAEPRLCDAIQQCGPSRWGIRASAPFTCLALSTTGQRVSVCSAVKTVARRGPAV